MSDSFGWMFGSEWTRDKILADRVAGIESHALATSSRLRSQLTKVQGNLERRLDALTAAFDAYVELGDVREQLLAHADTATCRRQAVAAFEAMIEGRTAPRLDTLEGQYWLPYAVNALIAVVEGRADTEAEEAARRLTPDADRFIVFAAGAIDHGERVQDRVADLLVGDATLTADQQILWEACVAGVYGDVFSSIRTVWATSLDHPDAADWVDWVSSQSSSDPRRQVEWLDTESGRSVPAPVDFTGTDAPDAEEAESSDASASNAPESVVALRTAVTSMIEEGLGEEQRLLARARELRATIEHPEQAARATQARSTPRSVRFGARRDSSRSDESEALPTIVQLVRTAWTEAPAGSELRTLLEGWVRPGLAAAAAAITLPSLTPAVVTARTPGGSVDVVASGPQDPRRVQIATTNIVRQHDHPRWYGLALGAGAAVSLLLFIVCVVNQSIGWAVVFAVGVLGLAGCAAWNVVQHRRHQAQIRTETALLEKALPEASQKAAERDRANQLTLEQARADQESLVRRLTDPSDD